jgi:hypothetical protein
VVAITPPKTITVNFPDSVMLNADVTDDGSPAGSTLTMGWSKASGPGAVSFAPAQQASTRVYFSAVGTYVLRLTASDGPLSSFDQATVQVNGATGQDSKSGPYEFSDVVARGNSPVDFRFFLTDAGHVSVTILNSRGFKVRVLESDNARLRPLRNERPIGNA